MTEHKKLHRLGWKESDSLCIGNYAAAEQSERNWHRPDLVRIGTKAEEEETQQDRNSA